MYRLLMAAGTLSLALLVQATPAKADFMNGNDLYEHCTEEKSDNLADIKTMHCVGYITGSADGLRNGNVFGQVLAGREEETLDFICVPERVTAGQMKDVVVSYLASNPSERHENASVLVAKALLRAWRCPA